MGIHRGPNLTRQDLVFGIDNGYGIANNDTSTRFAQGKPTINMASIDLADWTIESGAAKSATGDYYKGQPTYNCRSAVGSSWLAIYETISGLRTAAGSSGTVTMSLWVRNNFDVQFACYAFMGHDFGSTRTIAAHADWQRIQWTVNQSSMASDYMEFRPYTNNADIYLECTMPQVEVNVGTATPWVDGERSNTESIIDLKRATLISTANVSFDNDGLVSFDGTDDYLQLNNKFLPSTGAFTMEFLFQISTTGGRGGMFERKVSSPYNGALIGQGESGGWYFQVSNGSQSLTIDDMGYPSTNTWYHDIGVYDGVNTIKFYRNGILHDTVTGSNIGNIDSSGSRDNMRLMKRDDNSNTIGGKVAISKVYHKALSDAEVKRNYNVYRNRFNI